MPATMIAVPIADTAQMKRLTEFAADVTRLAAERRDIDLRALVDYPRRPDPLHRYRGGLTNE